MTTRQLAPIQKRFADRFMRRDDRIIGVRITRGPLGPAIVVRYHFRRGIQPDLGLPETFEGLPVITEAGNPITLAAITSSLH
jgi:hypothetical protein